MRGIATVLTLALAAIAAPAQAALVTYGFNCISSGVASACAAGQSQLFMDVTDQSAGGATLTNQVRFVFRNVGSQASSITDLYFDDGTLLGLAAVQNYAAGVDFSQGASPGNLPGGNGLSPQFQTTAGFSADSNPPTAPNGVNPGESVGVLFNLISGQTFFNTIAALNGEIVHAGGQPALRVGLHVQAFDGGVSAAFVNQGAPLPSAVPVPAAAWLLGSGLLGLLASRRRNPG